MERKMERNLLVKILMVVAGSALYFAFSNPLSALGAVLGIWGFVKALTQVPNDAMPGIGGGLTLAIVAVGLLASGRLGPEESLLLGLSLTFSGLLLGQVLKGTYSPAKKEKG